LLLFDCVGNRIFLELPIAFSPLVKVTLEIALLVLDLATFVTVGFGLFVTQIAVAGAIAISIAITIANLVTLPFLVTDLVADLIAFASVLKSHYDSIDFRYVVEHFQRHAYSIRLGICLIGRCKGEQHRDWKIFVGPIHDHHSLIDR
jgi:hypothetical protein